MSHLNEYEIVVEDDNGRYFRVIVLAVELEDAERRVAYILDPDSARIVRNQGGIR